MIDIFSKDSFRKRIESYSNGRLTVLYDRWGNPSIMCVIPKMKIKDVIKSFDENGHFININGLNSYNYLEKRYVNIFSLIDKENEITMNSVHPAFLVKNEDGSFEELNEIFVGTFLSTFSHPYSLPETEIIDVYNEDYYGGASSRKISEIVHKKNFNENQHNWRIMNAWVYNLIRSYMISRADESLRTIYGGFDSYGNIALTGLDNNKFKMVYTNTRDNKDIYIFDGCISKFITDDLSKTKVRQNIPFIAKGDQVYSVNNLKDIGEVKYTSDTLYKLELNKEISEELFPLDSTGKLIFEFDIFFDNLIEDKSILNTSTIELSYDSNTFPHKFIGAISEGTELYYGMGEKIGILSGIEYVTEKRSTSSTEILGGDTLYGKIYISNISTNILSYLNQTDTTSIVLFALSKDYISDSVIAQQLEEPVNDIQPLLEVNCRLFLEKYKFKKSNIEIPYNLSELDLDTTMYNLALHPIGKIEEFSDLGNVKNNKNLGDYLIYLKNIQYEIKKGEYIYREVSNEDPSAINTNEVVEFGKLTDSEMNPPYWLHVLYIPDRELFSLLELPKHYYEKKRIVEFFKDKAKKPPLYDKYIDSVTKMEKLYGSFRKFVDLVLPKPKKYNTTDDTVYKKTPNFIGWDMQMVSEYFKIFLYHFCKRDQNFSYIFGENDELISEEEKNKLETHAIFPITVYVDVEKYHDIYPPEWEGWNKVVYQYPEAGQASLKFTFEDLTSLRIDFGNDAYIEIYKHDGYKELCFIKNKYNCFIDNEKGDEGYEFGEETKKLYIPRFELVPAGKTYLDKPVYSLKWFDYYIKPKLLRKILIDERITKLVIFVPYIKDIEFRLFQIYEIQGKKTIGDGGVTRCGFPIGLLTFSEENQMNTINDYQLRFLDKIVYLSFYDAALEYFKYLGRYHEALYNENAEIREKAWNDYFRESVREKLKEYKKVFYTPYNFGPPIYIDISGINLGDLTGDSAVPIFNKVLNNHMVFNLNSKWYYFLKNNISKLVQKKALRIGAQDYCLPSDLLHLDETGLTNYWEDNPHIYNKMAMFTCLNRICVGLGLIYDPESNPVFEPNSFIKAENIKYFIPDRIIPDGTSGEDDQTINIYDPFTWSERRRNAFFNIIKDILKDKIIGLRSNFATKNFYIYIGKPYFSKYSSTPDSDYTSFSRAYYFNPEEKRPFWTLNNEPDIFSYKLHTYKDSFSFEHLFANFITDPYFMSIDIISEKDSTTFPEFGLNISNDTLSDTSNYRLWYRESSFNNIRVAFIDMDSTETIDSSEYINLGLNKYYANYVNESFTITFLIPSSVPIVLNIETGGLNIDLSPYSYVINPDWLNSVNNLNDLTSTEFTKDETFRKSSSFSTGIHFLKNAKVYMCLDKTGPLDSNDIYKSSNVEAKLAEEKFFFLGTVVDIKETDVLGGEFYKFYVRSDNTLLKQYHNNDMFVIFRVEHPNFYDTTNYSKIRYLSNKIAISKGSYDDENGRVTRSLYVYNPIDCTDESKTLLKRFFKKEVIEEDNLFLYSVLELGIHPIGEKLSYYCNKTVSGRFFEVLRFNACLQEDPIQRRMDTTQGSIALVQNDNGRFISRFPWIDNRHDLFRLFFSSFYKVPFKVKKAEYEVKCRFFIEHTDSTDFTTENNSPPFKKNDPIFCNNYLIGYCLDSTTTITNRVRHFCTLYSTGEYIPFLSALLKKFIFRAWKYPLLDNTAYTIIENIENVNIVKKYPANTLVIGHKSFSRFQKAKSMIIAEKKNMTIEIPMSVKFLLDTPVRKLYPGDKLYIGADPTWINKRKEIGEIRNVLKRTNDSMWEVYVDKYTFDTLDKKYEFSYPFYIRREIEVYRDATGNFYTRNIKGLCVGDNVFLPDSTDIYSDIFLTGIKSIVDDETYEVICRGTRYRLSDDINNADLISVGSKIPIVGKITSVFKNSSGSVLETSFSSRDPVWSNFLNKMEGINIYITNFGHKIHLGKGFVTEVEGIIGRGSYYLINIPYSRFSLPKYLASDNSIKFLIDDNTNVYNFRSRIFNIKSTFENVNETVLGTLELSTADNNIYDTTFLCGKKLYINSSNDYWAVIDQYRYSFTRNDDTYFVYNIKIYGIKYYYYNLHNPLIRNSNWQTYDTSNDTDLFYKKSTFWYQIEDKDKSELGFSKVSPFSFRYLSFKTGCSGIEFQLREMYDKNSVFRMFGISDFMPSILHSDLLIDGLYLRSISLPGSSSYSDNIFALIVEEGYPIRMNTIDDYSFYRSRFSEYMDGDKDRYKFNFSGRYQDYLKKYYVNIPFRLARKNLNNYSIVFVPFIPDKFSDYYHSTYSPISNDLSIDKIDRNSFLFLKGINNKDTYNSLEWLDELKYVNSLGLEFSSNTYSNYNFLSFFNNSEFKKYIQYFFLLNLTSLPIEFIKTGVFDFSNPYTTFNIVDKKYMQSKYYDLLLGKDSFMFYTGATVPYKNYECEKYNLSNSNLNFKGINIMNNAFTFRDSFFYRLVYLPIYSKK